MALPGMAAVTFNSTAPNGQDIVNVWHLSHETAGSPPDLPALTQLGADLKAWFQSPYLATLATNCVFNFINVSQVRDPAVAPPEVVLQVQQPISLNGTRAPASGGSSPQEACAILQFHTPNASRRFRGHLFLPPALSASEITFQTWSGTGAYMVANNALALKFAAGIVDASSRWSGSALSQYSLVIFSRRAAAIGQPSVANVSLVRASDKIRWLRSRNRGTR